MDANYSNGSSVYHGLSANLRKRFSNHYEFLASYTFSHAIDDSTDLQATLTPQDSYYPSSIAPTRCLINVSGLFSAASTSPAKSAAGGFRTSSSAIGLLLRSSIWFRPAVQHYHRHGDNFQFSSLTSRPNTSSTQPAGLVYPAVTSKYSPTGTFQEPCITASRRRHRPNPVAARRQSLGRNAGVQPWTSSTICGWRNGSISASATTWN